MDFCGECWYLLSSSPQLLLLLLSLSITRKPIKESEMGKVNKRRKVSALTVDSNNEIRVWMNAYYFEVISMILLHSMYLKFENPRLILSTCWCLQTLFEQLSLSNFQQVNRYHCRTHQFCMLNGQLLTKSNFIAITFFHRDTRVAIQTFCITSCAKLVQNYDFQWLILFN